MAATNFSGPVVSAGGFVGDVTGNVTGTISGGAITPTTVTASGAIKGVSLEAEASGTLSGDVTDGTVASLTLDPAYSGAHTVTRHNYIIAENPALTSTTLTDAALVRFDAAAGTHKAVDDATTKTTPGGVDAWVKINVNGTLLYMPAYTSKTA